MRELWRKRLRAHLNAQFKYLRLVFNDHFVLVLIILFGALLYGYSQLLQGLHPTWWWWLAVALALTLVGQLGGIASLAEPADATFLLPQTSAYSRYLFQARRYSLVLPSVAIVAASLIAWPLMSRFGAGDWPRVLTLALALWGFKDLDLWLQLLADYRHATGRFRFTLAAIEFAALWVGLWWHPAIAMVVALVLNLGFRWRVGEWFNPASLDWLGLIQTEERRMNRLYRFYNLFTDVPGFGGTVKRRRYLDPLAKLVRKTPGHLWTYLYLRGFLRRSEWLGLTVRLAVLGAVAVALVSQWWLAAILAAVVIYLIGFQLLPFYLVYDEIVFTHLYPAGKRLPAFTGVVIGVLVVVSIVLAAGAFVAGWQAGLIVLGTALIVSLAFGRWYLPWRLTGRD